MRTWAGSSVCRNGRGPEFLTLHHPALLLYNRSLKPLAREHLRALAARVATQSGTSTGPALRATATRQPARVARAATTTVRHSVTSAPARGSGAVPPSARCYRSGARRQGFEGGAASPRQSQGTHIGSAGSPAAVVLVAGATRAHAGAAVVMPRAPLPHSRSQPGTWPRCCSRAPAPASAPPTARPSTPRGRGGNGEVGLQSPDSCDGERRRGKPPRESATG